MAWRPAPARRPSLAGHDGTPRLTPDEQDEVLVMLTDTHPGDHGYGPPLWTGNLVRRLVQDELRVALSGPATTRLVRRLGIPLRRPQAWRPSAPGRTGAPTWFLGETVVPGRPLPPGTPTGVVPRTTATVLSVAATSGVVRFSVRSGLLRPAVVLDVLERLSAEAPGPLAVVVGEHDAYRDQQVTAWARRTRGRVVLHPSTPDGASR